ncbi:T9SS type A sorting domain-containing protein [Flavobacterium sp. SM2513]|uniref:T9SS type A sorting domain-containing protein n=1 Tax=Flavobacterium sp. SM2513 TaxID=3424766 RepID=UPI003D7F910B
MKKNTTRFTFMTLLMLLLQATTSFAQFADGVFILNEGGAGSGNASVSFFSNNVLTNSIYATANPNESALGDTGQSIAFNGDYAYIVLNISNTIKVINRNTFAYVATISTGLDNPRYMAFANGKGYVTNWGQGSTTDDYLAVINLATHSVENTIALDGGVEKISTINDKLYVAHQGGFGVGNTLSVVNPISLTVEASISVGDVPNSMLVNNGFLYVLCGGSPSWSAAETDGKLIKINLTTNTVESTLNFPSLHPSNLKGTATGTDFYFTIDANVYTSTLASTTIPTTALFSLGAQGVYGIYGMELIDDQLFVADAGNYVSPGTVYIYTTSGTLVQNYTVGVIPNSFYKAEGTLSRTPIGTKLAVRMYPNPATNVFYLNTAAPTEVKLYDTAGRVVKKTTYSNTGVTVSGLTAGIYIVEMTTTTGRSVQRLIVN